MSQDPNSRVRLRALVREGRGLCAVRLSGVIDEHNHLATLAGRIQGGVIAFDLGGLTRINSVGVRDWVLFMGELSRRGDQVVLYDCPPAVMEQVNLITNFVQGARVYSFFAPYYCERCDLEENHRIVAHEQVASHTGQAPAFPCGQPACAKTFDDVEESYFAFLEDTEAWADRDVDTVVETARTVLAEAGDQTDPPLRCTSPTAPTSSPDASPESAAAGPVGHRTADVAAGRTSDMVFLAFVGLLVVLLAVMIYLLMSLE